MVADSAWAIATATDPADQATYFAQRKSQGYNTILMGILVAPYLGGNANATTYDGVAPFTSGTTPATYNFATPNATYFARIKAAIDLAATYGFCVVAYPVDTGGWLRYIISAGSTTMTNYGVYLGNTFLSCPNIIWASGNDYNQVAGGDGGSPGEVSGWGVSATDADVIAVANGIHSVSSQWLQTVELGQSASGISYPFGQSSSTDDSNWWSILGLNWGYTYLPAYETAKVDWLNSSIPVIPYIMGESGYEGPYWAPPLINLRKVNWASSFSGGSGFFYGNYTLYPFPSGWLTNPGLNTPGAIQSGYVASFFQKINWLLLVPDFGHTFVTTGYGTEFTNLASSSEYSSSPNSNTNLYVYLDNYVPAALASDGSFGTAYLQRTSPITVNLTKLTGPMVSAQWYDPTNNTYRSVAGSPFVRNSSQVFAPTGNNSAGDPDWVLLLTSSSTYALE